MISANKKTAQVMSGFQQKKSYSYFLITTFRVEVEFPSVIVTKKIPLFNPEVLIEAFKPLIVEFFTTLPVKSVTETVAFNNLFEWILITSDAGLGYIET